MDQNNQTATPIPNQGLKPQMPSNVALSDDIHNFNIFVVPLLANHQDIQYNNKKQTFEIKEEVYENLNKTEKNELKALEQNLFARFRVRDIDGLPNKGYIFEECDPKTGQVISSAMYLNPNITEQDIPLLKQKAKESAVSVVHTQTREAGLMYQGQQQELVHKGEELNPHVVVKGNGIKTQFGYICSGLALLTVYDLLSKKEMLEKQKVKNLIRKLKAKKKKRAQQEAYDDDEETQEINSLNIPKTFKAILMKPNFEQALVQHTQHIKEELSEIANALKLDKETVAQIQHTQNNEIFETAFSGFDALKELVRQELSLNNDANLLDLHKRMDNHFKIEKHNQFRKAYEGSQLKLTPENVS